MTAEVLAKDGILKSVLLVVIVVVAVVVVVFVVVSAATTTVLVCGYSAVDGAAGGT